MILGFNKCLSTESAIQTVAWKGSRCFLVFQEICTRRLPESSVLIPCAQNIFNGRLRDICVSEPARCLWTLCSPLELSSACSIARLQHFPWQEPVSSHNNCGALSADPKPTQKEWSDLHRVVITLSKTQLTESLCSSWHGINSNTQLPRGSAAAKLGEEEEGVNRDRRTNLEGHPYSIEARSVLFSGTSC